MSEIFREIDEELRRDNFAKLWRDYGKYVIALAVLAVLATAGIVEWRDFQLKQRQEEGMRYAAALDLAQKGKNAEAADAFAQIARESSAGRAVMARLEEAALRAKSGDADKAVALYDGIAQDGGVNQVYRDFANLLAARYSFNKADPTSIVARLKPLTTADNAWHATALELTAAAQLKAGNRQEALASYTKLADDLTAPQGVRQRATEMVAVLHQ